MERTPVTNLPERRRAARSGRMNGRNVASRAFATNVLVVIGVAMCTTGIVALMNGRDESLVVGGIAVGLGVAAWAMAALIKSGRLANGWFDAVAVWAAFMFMSGTSLIEPLVWNDRWWISLGYAMVIFVAGSAAILSPWLFTAFLGFSVGAWVFSLTTDSDRPVPLVDGLALVLLASLAAIAVYSLLRHERQSNRLLTKQLRHSATRDALTGLLNRAGVNSILTDGDPAGRSIEDADWCAFIDVNSFKTINDTQGHEAGDQVLRDCADSIWMVTRPTDVVARWGGDEFVVFGHGKMPSEEDLEARIGIELLRRAVLHGYDHPLNSPITVTVGVAQRSATDAAKDLIRAADLHMYERRRTEAVA